MKKLVLALTLGLSLGSGFVDVAHAQKLSVKAARAQIQTCYNRYGQAMKTKNINIINGLLAADYQMYTMGGKTTDRNVALRGDQFLFRLPARITRHDTIIKSIEARGSDMIVVVETTSDTSPLVGTSKGLNRSIVTYRDFWSPMKNANGWVLRQSVERSATAWINGQKMQ